MTNITQNDEFQMFLKNIIIFLWKFNSCGSGTLFCVIEIWPLHFNYL